MSDKHELFTGRAEAVELFRLLRASYTPELPFPILNYVAPVGSGKSALIEYLRDEECNSPVLPHMQFDFSLTNIPKDVLFILVEIRNRLRRRTDENDKHLTFPRFDFGAAIVLSALEERNAFRLSDGEIKANISNASNLFNEWFDSIDILGNFVPQISLILSVTRTALKIEQVDKFLRWLEQGPVWNWYKAQADRLSLPANARIDRIMRRLDEMADPGDSGRALLVKSILPEALLADLNDALSNTTSNRAWRSANYAIAFLNDFEVLMDDPGKTGKHLLEALTLNSYIRQGGTNPLLLVLGSQVPVIGDHWPDEPTADGEDARQQAQRLYSNWLNQLPPPRAKWRLPNLLLQMPLRNFRLNETSMYLQRFGSLYVTQAFQDSALVERIQQLTSGLPLYLSLVAQAILEAGTSYTDIDLVHPMLGGESIENSLLETYLDQLGSAERKPLIWSALPHEFDKDTLRAILNFDDIETDRLWDIFRRLAFIRTHRDRLVIQPLVRKLLLQKVPPTRDPKRDYVVIHKKLQDHFHDEYTRQPDNDHARLEEVYHALALGNPQPAIDLGIWAQKDDQTLWLPLLDVVSRDMIAGPLGAEIQEVEQRAEDALKAARSAPSIEESVTAIVLYRWLLNAAGAYPYREMRLWQHLANAYDSLQSGDRQAHLEAANAAKDQSLKVAQRLLSSSATPQPDQAPQRSIPLQPPRPTEPKLLPVVPILPRLPVLTPTKPEQQLLPIFRLPQPVAWIVMVSIVLILTFAGTGLYLWVFPPHPNADAGKNYIPPPVEPQFFPPNQQGIGVTLVADCRNCGLPQSYVGLSDGSIPFDIVDRPDRDLKIQASDKFHHQDTTSAAQLWHRAVQTDVNDAEAQIYLENRQYANRCIYFVVATDLSGSTGAGVTKGRDYLQGAYLVQKAHNSDTNSNKICLLVANMGSDPSYADKIVAPQIVNAARHLPIKAVLGWPNIVANSQAVTALNNAHIPIVSPANYNISDVAPNLFHVVLANEMEGIKDAIYAEHNLKPNKMVISYNQDLTDTYSSGLTSGFEQQLQQDGWGNSIVDTIPYTSCDSQQATPDCQQQFVPLVQRAARSSPDLLFFAGNANDSNGLLASLSQATFPQDLRVLGGDALYQLVGYSSFDRPNFQYLDFTAFAYPDESSVAPMKQAYMQAFDAGDTNPPQNSYGYSRPDNDAITVYNAMSILVQATNEVPNGDFTAQQLLQTIASNQFQLIGTDQNQTLQFDNSHRLTGMNIVVLRVNQQGYISLVQTI